MWRRQARRARRRAPRQSTTPESVGGKIKYTPPTYTAAESAALQNSVFQYIVDKPVVIMSDTVSSTGYVKILRVNQPSPPSLK